MKHVVKEWEMLWNILKSAAYEILGSVKKLDRIKYLKIWDYLIKHSVESNKMSYKKWLASKKLEDKIEYKRYTAVAKREARRRDRDSCDKVLEI